jgi:Family of unknown function (DUF5824)
MVTRVILLGVCYVCLSFGASSLPDTDILMKPLHVPLKYVPLRLSTVDKQKQIRMLKESRKAYRQGRYITRKKLSSYPQRPSHHVTTAKRMYNVDHIGATPALARASGCSVSALQQIIKKGEGAYFSSGSRPSQTAQSWGVARLASALTGGKSAAIDFAILEKGCQHSKKAYRLAVQSRKKHKYGQRHTRKIVI